MSKLSTIRKQIAALEAQAARIAKEEMDSALGKVKSLMSDFGLTIEHLTQSVTGKAVTKKSKSAPKKASAKKVAPTAKYADPKSGKTWSGFGRAPGWIASAKNRDAFLVTKGVPTVTGGTPDVGAKKAVSKKTAVAPLKKAAKTIAKKAPRASKKVATSTKKAAVAVTKKVVIAKRASPKKSVAKKAAAPSAPSTTAPTPTSE
jgi:DNA-binding protein H-NS